MHSAADQKKIKIRHLQGFSLGNKVILSDFMIEVFIYSMPYFYVSFCVCVALFKQMFRNFQVNNFLN